VKNKYKASSTGKNIILAGNDPRLLMTSKTPKTYTQQKSTYESVK